MTVTDDDFAEEERERFQKFLKQRKEDKELGAKFYGDEKALREKEAYEDDYMGALKDEATHPYEETERITDLLKREKPKADRLKEAEFGKQYDTEVKIMDKKFMDDMQIENDNVKLDLEAMKLDMQEI